MALRSDAVLKGLHSSIQGIAGESGTQVGALFGQFLDSDLGTDAMNSFIERALAILRRQSRMASDVAYGTYRTARTLDRIPGTAPSPSPFTFVEEKAGRSLRIVGPEQLVRQIKAGRPYQDAAESALTLVEGVAQRYPTQYGMGRMSDLARKDKQAIGYARVTSTDPCYFCSMLASRGPVYNEQSFWESDRRFKDNLFPPEVFSGEQVAKVHDHCNCVLVPVWSRSASVVDDAERLYDVWREVQKKYAYTGLDMVHIWRLYWEDRMDRWLSRNV